jgi:transposase
MDSSPGTWLADLCAPEGIPVVLGHALYLQAIHGGNAKHEKLDSHKIAVLRRGGMRPQASVSPAARRATRDLLRRRIHLMHKRADLLAPGQTTHSQSPLPEIGQNITSKATRDGVAERCADPAGHKSSAVDLALRTANDQRLTDLDRSIGKSAKQHDANTFSRLRTVPGVGKLWARGLRYAIHDIHRVPRVQDCVSSARLGTCAKASAGQRYGPSGKNIGHAYRTWAFADAAGRCLRHHPAGQKCLATLERQHGPGTALTILAHKLARAGYDRLTRQTGCELETFLPDEREQRG